MAEYVPEDVMVDILSRLPAKSLIRFKTVCKTWYNLVHQPDFTKLHLSRAIHSDERDLLASSPQQFVYHHRSNHLLQGNKLMFTINDPLGKTFFPERSRCLGSCNGVICLVMKNQVCLVNPYTKEYKIVNFSESTDLNCFKLLYLGYDTSCEEHKLVRFFNSRNGDGKISVYSLSDVPCCSTIEIVDYTICGDYSEVFLEGALHFVALHKHRGHGVIIGFNIGEKVIRELWNPDYLGIGAYGEDLNDCSCLGVIGGQLALLKFNNNVEVYVMQNYGAKDSWCKIFSSFVHPLKALLPRCFAITEGRPLYFTKNAEFLIKYGSNVLMFDLIKKTVENLDVVGFDWSEVDKIMTHVASLVGVNSGTYVASIIEDEEVYTR